jgi:cytochrome c551/c552
MYSNCLRGVYRPLNPNKYKGNAKNIIFRSSWELKMFRYCDTSARVLEWSSEELIIPYVHPFSGGYRRYFPDIYMKYQGKNGQIKKRIIEIKPGSQVRQPKIKKKRTKRYVNEVQTYLINRAKWDAAAKYAEQHGASFEIFTEKTLGIH